jgi:hypothetical protein
MGIDQQFLYPPQVEAYMPAFLLDGTNTSCRIYFSKTQFNKASDIIDGHMQVSVSYIQSGKSALDTALWPNQIKLAAINEDPEITTDYKYYITLTDDDIQSGFQQSQFYKVQLRFSAVNPPDPGGITTDPGAVWFNTNLESFSEWSTITLIKGIPNPVVKLQGFLMSENLMASVYDSFNYTAEQFENGLFINNSDYTLATIGYNTCDRIENPDTLQWTQYWFKKGLTSPTPLPTLSLDNGWTKGAIDSYPDLFTTLTDPGDLWMTSIEMEGTEVKKVNDIEVDFSTPVQLYPLTAGFWDSEYASTLFPNIFVGNSDTYGTLSFVGQYSCEDASEPLKYYEAYLYDANTLELISTIEKSYPDSNYSAETETNPFYEDGYYLENGVYSGFHCRFKTILDDGRKYKVTVKLITKNDYLIETSYTFTTAFSQIFLSNIKVTTQPDEENGRVKIILSPYDSHLPMEAGNIFILRSDHRSNFGIWEMLYEVDDAALFLNNTIELYDHTVESGVLYKYYVSGNRDNSPTAVLYEDMFLVAENKQLKIQFNPKITSFKYVVSENKFETLGSKYPFVRRNANTRYREFGISGLISMEIDENELFFDDRQVRPHVLPAGTINFDSLHLIAQIGDILKVGQGAAVQYFRRHSISSSATNTDWDSIPATIAEKLLDNYYTETAFRQAVIDFLYNNTVKLFKSTTEGNILVKVTNVSLSPVEALGRRLYSFDATLVEIDDFTLDKCIEYNVQVI